jgi:hypothetical protein
MAYKRSFRYLRTHLLAERPIEHELESDRDLVYGTLRSGHAYIAMDALAPSTGFRFWATGEQELIMGDEAEAGSGEWLLRAELPQPARTRLLRDGVEILSNEGSVLEHQVESPGVYRLEAYLDAKGRERTWILSNPIYLR